MIELNNALKGDSLPREVAEPFAQLLAPIAPHLAAELWQRLKGDKWGGSIMTAAWPVFDAALCVDAEVEVPVQILGKLRSRIRVAADASEADMEAAALADPKIVELLAGKTVRKVIVVKGRLVNIVAN